MVSSTRRVSRTDRWLRVASEPAASDAAPPPVVDDEALINAVIQGDTRVSGLLYDHLLAIVDRTIVRILGRFELDRQDLIQTSFEQIVRTVVEGKFRRACSLPTWATTVAAHVAFKALRSRTRERRVIDRTVDEGAYAGRASDLDVEHDVDDRLLFERARLHLTEIDPKKAMAVVLHDVLGHELSEIAVMTETSVANAQSRLVRGRKELIARMQRDPRAESRKEHAGEP
jgi:RNA polymerase sigma-70 factor (ECF subfamily)